MKVITRSGDKEDVKFDLITEKIKELSCEKPYWGSSLNIDPVMLAQNVCSLIHDNITTTELDDFTASFSATSFKKDPDYLVLAGRVAINNHHKNTKVDFYEKMKILHDIGIINDSFIKFVEVNKDFINECINYDRDYKLTFFGFKSLEKSYLLKCDGKIIERPQDLFMRVSIAIHMNNLEMIKNVYDSFSNKYYTHATPTLF